MKQHQADFAKQRITNANKQLYTKTRQKRTSMVYNRNYAEWQSCEIIMNCKIYKRTFRWDAVFNRKNCNLPA